MKSVPGWRGVWVAALAVACTGTDRVAPPPTATTTLPATTAPAPTTAVPPITGATTAPAPSPAGDEVTLHAYGLRLGEAGDGVRVVVRSDASELTVAIRSAASALRVCPVAGLDAPVPATACVTPTGGRPTRVPLAPAYRGVEVTRTGGGESATLDEVAVAYRAREREMEIRLPTMAPGLPAGGTLFQLTPAAAGSFRATATWSGSAGQAQPRGELTVEEGPASNRRLVAKAEGAPGGRVSATPSSPVELSLTLRVSGPVALVAPMITVTWPSG